MPACNAALPNLSQAAALLSAAVPGQLFLEAEGGCIQSTCQLYIDLQRKPRYGFNRCAALLSFHIVLVASVALTVLRRNGTVFCRRRQAVASHRAPERSGLCGADFLPAHDALGSKLVLGLQVRVRVRVRRF